MPLITVFARVWQFCDRPITVSEDTKCSFFSQVAITRPQKKCVVLPVHSIYGRLYMFVFFKGNPSEKWPSFPLRFKRTYLPTSRLILPAPGTLTNWSGADSSIKSSSERSTNTRSTAVTRAGLAQHGYILSYVPKGGPVGWQKVDVDWY